MFTCGRNTKIWRSLCWRISREAKSEHIVTVHSNLKGCIVLHIERYWEFLPTWLSNAFNLRKSVKDLIIWIHLAGLLTVVMQSGRGFHEHIKLAILAFRANFVFPNIFSFLLYLHQMMLVNVKLDISGFQGCGLHWSNPFLMVQLKRSWQHRNSWIADSLSRVYYTWGPTVKLYSVRQ